MSEETPCFGPGREHDYHPRYDEHPVTDVANVFFNGQQVKKTYIGDRCIRCGDWIPRPKR